MRRAGAAVFAAFLFLMLCCVPACASADRLTLTYVPPSERGTVFYLDASYDGTLSAAMLELRYDASLVQYRGVSAVSAASTVRARAQDGVVRIVFGDSAGVSGRLSRVEFKAVGAGSAVFSLKMTEGVDGGLNRIGLPQDGSLTVSFDQNGGSGSGGSYVSYHGAASNKTASSTADSAEGDAPDGIRIVDIRETSVSKVMVILAIAGSVTVVLLVVLGFTLGRRLSKKKNPADEDDREESEE